MDEGTPLYPMTMPHIQQQLEELECLSSMFPSEGEMHVDPYVKVLFESAMQCSTEATTIDLPLVHVTLFLTTCIVDNYVAELKLTFPIDYPTEPLDLELVCPTLPRTHRTSIVNALQDVAAACAGAVSTLQVYHEAVERLGDYLARSTRFDDTPFRVASPRAVNSSEIGRRTIYFHHIIAPGKRQVIKDWAKELQLGGFSKIGWPGVIVVEGIEANVQEYVKRLQHLRWKQMVVRGEQIDTTRRLEPKFVELTDMSILASQCADAGLTDLFLTAMKIYR